MNVFVTRASGYVGTPLCHELQFHGHTVLALARSDASAQKLSDAGYTVHRGSLDDLASLQACARAADGVIHTAFNHDFSRYKESGEDDLRVVQAIGEALAGTNKPFVITSGTTVVTAHTRGLESDPGDPESEDIAESVGKGLGIPVKVISEDEADEHFGMFGELVKGNVPCPT